MAGAFLAMAHGTMAQATPKPPERMTYQGFLTGADGVALGNTAPKAYDVLFRIFDAEQGGTLLWGEQQTVTVDKGYFSVLLGEGAAVGGVPNAGIVFSSLFTGATASDRFVGVTVKGIGTGGTDVDILPRVRFLSSPYAYLAASAIKLVQTTGADLLTSSGNTVTVSGSLVANGLTAGTIDATNSVTAGILHGTTNIITPVLRAGDVTITNALTAGSIAAGSISATSALNVPSLAASGNVQSGGTVSAGTLVITNDATVLGRGLLTSGNGTKPLRAVIGRYWWNGTTITEEHDQPDHALQKLDVGRYRITLTKPFNSTPYPVCIVTGYGGAPYTFLVSSPRPSTANTDYNRIDKGPTWSQFDVFVKYTDGSGFHQPIDSGFNFIIIGAE